MVENKILIVGPSWIGDMVMAQSLFITLRQLNPDAIMDVLAPKWSRPLLQRMPEVNEAIEMPVGHGSIGIGKRWRLAKWLQRRSYQQAIILPNSLKSALVPWFAGIPLRTGWRGEMRYGLINDLRHLDKRQYPLMVQRFNALAYPAGKTLSERQPVPLLQVDREHYSPLREAFSLFGHGRVLALCPGAEFGPAKRWPAQHYADVARNKIEQGWQVWLMGSGKDRDIAEAIVGYLDRAQQSCCRVLAGRTTLAQVIDLLAWADAVVSNDSGLMHISAALRKPLMVVYGSSSPDFTPPLHEHAAIVRNSLDCSPCFQRECLFGHLKCLHELSPRQVIEALDGLLSRPENAAIASVVNHGEMEPRKADG